MIIQTYVFKIFIVYKDFIIYFVYNNFNYKNYLWLTKIIY